MPPEPALLLFVLSALPPLPPSPPLPVLVDEMFELEPVAVELPPFVLDVAELSPPLAEPPLELPPLEPWSEFTGW